MKKLNRLFISLLVLFVSIFCSGCLAGSKLDNALEQINHTSYTLEIKTYQYWEGKYSLSEMIAYKESIIYQNENQAYAEMNTYDRYDQLIMSEYQYLEIVDENIYIYNKNSGNWAMNKKMDMEQYASTNPSMLSFKSKPSELFKYNDGLYKGNTELLEEELRFFLKTLYDQSGLHGKFFCDIAEYEILLDEDLIKKIYIQIDYYPQGYSGDRYSFDIYMEFSNIGETTVDKPLEIK